MAHPNTDKWLFEKWPQAADVEEVLTATLPNKPVSGDEQLGVLSNPPLASPLVRRLRKKNYGLDTPSGWSLWIAIQN